MKKAINLFILSAVITAVPVQIKAADWSFGITGFYMLWKPAIRSEFNNINMKPMLLTGPALGVTFAGNWSFGITGLLSPVFPEVEYDCEFTDTSGPGTVHFDSKTQRLDCDVTIAYQFMGNIKFFAGYKKMICTFDSQEGTITDGSYLFSTGTIYKDLGSNMFDSNSAGAGMGITIPFASGFSINGNISFIYSKIDVQIQAFEESGPGNLSDNPLQYNDTGIGGNAVCSVSYYSESISMVFSLGGRAQYVTYFNSGEDIMLEDDYFYGLILSAMYIF